LRFLTSQPSVGTNGNPVVQRAGYKWVETANVEVAKNLTYNYEVRE